MADGNTPSQPKLAAVSSSNTEVAPAGGHGYSSDSEPSVLHDGGLSYVRVKADNGSLPSYQEAVGAPVEISSPLGYDVGWITVIFLNVNQMIGTGVFSTRM